jgi:hypothetical protein
MKAIFPESGRLALFIIVAILCRVPETRGQSAHKPNRMLDQAQFMLPWDGPGAAFFNPSHLAETDRFDIHASLFGSVSGKAGSHLMHGSARVLGNLFSGIAYISDEEAIDGTNAVYELSTLTPMIAYGLDSIAGSGYSAGFGFSVPIHGFSAFGVESSSSPALDLGAHMVWPSMGIWGGIHIGITVRNLASGSVSLPDDNPAMRDGEYDVLLPNYDASFLLSNLAGRIDIFSELNLLIVEDLSVGSYRDDISHLKSFGAEVRPNPKVGLKIERTWRKSWIGGFTFRIPIKGLAVVGAEMNMSHDRFLTERDQGRGYLWSLALNAGM